MSAATAGCPEIYQDQVLARILSALHVGDPQAIQSASPVFARFLRGTQPEHFLRPTDQRFRKIVFFMDNEGLASLAGKDLRGRLEEVGYTKDYILDLYQNGTQFKLIVYRDQGQFLPATWDNLALLLKQAYRGSDFAKLVERHLPALKAKKFTEIEAQAPARLSALNKLGKTSKDFMTYKKLDVNSTLWQFRAFLYNELRVSELYSGDGYTYTPDGVRGMREYIGNVGALLHDKIGSNAVMDLIP